MSKLTKQRLRELMSRPPTGEVIGTAGEILPELYRIFMRAVRQVIPDRDVQAEIEWQVREVLAYDETQQEPTPLDRAWQRYEAALAPAKMDETGETSSDLIYIELMRYRLRNCRDREEMLRVAGLIYLAFARIQNRYNRTGWKEVEAAWAELQTLLSE